MPSQDKEHLLDLMWELFQNQDDVSSDTDPVVNVCYELVTHYDFDVGMLSGKLYEFVNMRLGEDAKEAHAEDQCELFEWMTTSTRLHAKLIGGII